VDIHPEITGINRIQLLFVSALSDDKLLADVQTESIYLGSLQTTDNTTPADSFKFTMQEFGADWWHTWRSPAGLHSYDINIYAPYDEDNTARVVVYDLTTDENGDVVTDTSSFYFVGNVDISHMR
jgi:hypothetical protein